MAARLAVLVDERDNRLGRIMVTDSCFVIEHDDRTFVRTGKMIRPNPRLNAMAIVFEETDVYVRARLDPL